LQALQALCAGTRKAIDVGMTGIDRVHGGGPPRVAAVRQRRQVSPSSRQGLEAPQST
jgi:hypothetical protein